jgi:hypothetical protein
MAFCCLGGWMITVVSLKKILLSNFFAQLFFLPDSLLLLRILLSESSFEFEDMQHKFMNTGLIYKGKSSNEYNFSSPLYTTRYSRLTSKRGSLI